MSQDFATSPEHFWMPFTANRQFKASPRLLERAEGMYYTASDGRQVLDGTAGLWCCNAGHGRREISEAVSKQIARMDFAPTFQMGHPLPFELAEKLAAISPEGLNRVFFTNSGSESADTALKIALAYQRAIGQGSRTRLIGRELAYHGVGFGGMSVGGMANNRRAFGPMLPGVDHLPHTLDLQRNAFSKGLPQHGVERADELERLVTLHGAENIAAVIVEPMSGSAGVILPPVGYLQRLREITAKHGILLIFDEVITGFGRVGEAFAAQRWGVTPDILTCAKGLTNGAIPMGAVFVADRLYDAFMQGPESVIEFFHGYTYSGHPVACAAALATQQIYQQENLFQKAIDLEPYWQEALFGLRDLPNVIDIRTVGLVAGIQFAAHADGVGKRGYEVFRECFENGLLVRASGDTIALSPALIVEKAEIDRMMELLADGIRKAG
ncbi:MAG: aminotransferase class III-fold pyridoxal phosphate-dependent enzyme [Pseudomonas stutzeri]|uniref:aspartate aminotransferase family protein n=1 Tax=Stutzerimonas stutzeri TaxID=316 RepID=UPI0016A92A13|nr:aminotransferase class III-fold pyridoxal phosphate-dependent enzyme [Stutzerimonas stutzeri]NIM54280.1 aminotransferase class III-fold pyridoxal phosphate-dependent enzyme [Stutzerimonas stutzeri]NIM87932.1 aminotransferase class III-fold pyridoxal phosphate-dependent enzyme [Stutzerimonas stutzeri]NIN79617.1 aminotransferase class III-fold pyridoxal phosphate-dependent enzyme [Stutzerimonas stutzeri]NIP01867.1 aminotransferase class III-fold pyridoxal phosphate-dependent enzyme [Stutzerimo